MILEELAAYAAERVKRAKEIVSLEEIRKRAYESKRGAFLFEKAITGANEAGQMAFICEVKKASPSKGIISRDFPYMEIAKSYEEAGADCISCLTEPKWFMGSDEIFQHIREQISIPMIRKDFTVDAYQIYEAKCMGADAVLLICALLDTGTIREYLTICHELGMTALVEAHDAIEIASAVEAGARVIGVNNRNLKNFTVNFSNAENLREQIPEETLYVAESGVSGVEDVEHLAGIGANAVLMGEVLMKERDKKQLLAKMRRACYE